MPQTDNLLPLRRHETQFLGFLSAFMNRSPFEGLVQDIPAPGGFCDYGDVFPLGEHEEVKPGIMSTINRVRAVSKQLIVKPYSLTVGIDYQTMINTNARMAGSTDRIAQSMAMARAASIIKRLTALIITPGKGFMADASGGSGNDADFFKATAKYIPFSAKSFINADTADSTSSAALFRTSILRVIGAMSAYPNSLEGYVNMPPDDGPAFVVMIPPILFGLAVDAFGTAPGSTVVGLNQINAVVDGMGIQFRVNQFLGDESTAVAAAKWYVFARNPVYKPLVMAVQLPSQFRASNLDDSHTITFNEMLMQSYYGVNVGYGSDFVAYKQTDS